MSSELPTRGVCTYEYEPVVFSDAAKPVRPAVYPRRVKRDRRDKGQVTLASCDYALFPWREDRDEVVLAAYLCVGWLDGEDV